ncbi:hypothetical protein C1E24_05555 [Pseudoalteromonas phenolica]|uniref:Soluble cytochrome b562 n=1 Tax=Pseudoalteromonas phenolica TaxID=161398 RepID=A0A5R9Q638_9GAMM|nr:cytochrome b562 [Pseudoalteromonas phenolica]TLX48264.1 hypothetical protein C1E24_05555 [Pseudoalteromonas phenolica]
MKYLVLLLLSVSMFSFSSSAQTSDLSVTMKNIGHAYKKAVRSTDDKEIISQIDEMIILIQKSKKANFKADLKEQSIEGLDKVITVLQESKRFIEKGEIAKAKSKLKKVDVLREKYHELHEPPSVWELLFG